jgi:Zn ribbon nucleic-acid-binding protein
MTQNEIKHSEIFDEFKDKVAICPKCSSEHIIKKGYYLSEKYLHKIQRLNCIDCGHRFHGIPKIMETEEDFKYKSKTEYPNSMCSICEQQGCDIRVSYQNISQMYHKKCFKMFQRKALKYALTKYPNLRK